MSKEEKIPFGKEWIEGMTKHPKELLVDLLKNAYKELIELKQLEIKNNGWIKIESEEDIPKYGTECYFIVSGFEENEYFGHYESRLFWHKNEAYSKDVVTHYKTIEKPENKPLY